MITVFHEDNKVVSVFDFENDATVHLKNQKPIMALFHLAELYPNRLITWCLKDLENHLNLDGFKKVFSHRNIMSSFEINEDFYINKRIGYVDSTPFVNVKKNVRYPTWLMSDCIGGVSAEVLLKFDQETFRKDELAYTLSSIAKTGMLKGLFCYSAPDLLRNQVSNIESRKSSDYTLYKFIKQHYKTRWIFINFFNSLIYERKFQLLPLLNSLFVVKRKVVVDFSSKISQSNKSLHKFKTIDVVIPTIARKEYLKKVLIDLSKQTLLPQKVIIVEQLSTAEQKLELDFLTQGNWPFKIKHHFITQTGACNARNIALKDVESDTVFLADDDIRFGETLLADTISNMNNLGLNAVTLSCRRVGEEEKVEFPMQWHTFGSGCSVINASLISKVKFDLAFEHGFGEDGDFGMNLRYLGSDVIYLPSSRIVHLKANYGGFRTKYIFPWDSEKIKPKPSPTIMLHSLRHSTLYQHLGYKTLLFIKFFKVEPDYQIFRYISNMLKRWDKSIYWAKHLEANSDIR